MSNQSLLESETEFALKFLATLANDESCVFSPLSISIALALVHSAAKGETKSELLSTLLNGASDEQLSTHFSGISESLRNSSQNGVETNIANRIFVNEKFSVKEDYLANVEKHYKAGAQSLNFEQKEEAAKVINKFVSDNTSGKIKDLVSSNGIDKLFAMLVNAVYFKADWQDKFEKHNSFERQFEFVKGAKPIEFLNQSEVYRSYAEDQTFQLLVLPYTDSSYSFAIFLPRQKGGLKMAMETFNGAQFQSLLGKISSTFVNIAIPKIKLESKIDFKQNLESLGIRKIFEDSGDVSGLADGVTISSGTHKALIEVDEDGTTAAASSVLAATLECLRIPPNPPIDFTADHPFMYAVLKDNHPLFLGIHA